MEFNDPKARFVRAPDQLSCELDGEIATLNLGTQFYFGFTDVAAVIWRELESPRTMSELSDAILSEFNVQREECLKDLSIFLRTLQNRGLLEINSVV